MRTDALACRLVSCSRSAFSSVIPSQEPSQSELDKKQLKEVALDSNSKLVILRSRGQLEDPLGVTATANQISSKFKFKFKCSPVQ